jgi:glycosyltransferase involved in cell wall biosynthesis
MRLTDEDRELIQRLNAPAPVGAQFGITNYLHRLHQRRPDLRSAFPDLDRDGGRFVEWILMHGRYEVPIPPQLLPSEPAEFVHFRGVPSARLSHSRAGVNVVGHLTAELGTGEAARQLLAALRAVEIPALPIEALPVVPSSNGHAYHSLPPASATFPISVICTNPDYLTFMRRAAGDDFFAGRYNVGYWWREVGAPLPFEWRLDLDLISEVWAGSEHCADCLRPFVAQEVYVVPAPIHVPDPPILTREQLGLPDGFLFLFLFNYTSVARRKNPFGVVEAFRRAFEPGAGAALVIKCAEVASSVKEHADLLALAEGHPDIRIVEGFVPYEHKNAMLAACDCYVSLHRAEGFGMPIAEAMYLGKPTIATGWSGNLDFMTADNSHLVPYRLVELGEDLWPYRADALWAEPDVDEAAKLMRVVFADPAASQALGARAAADVRRTHSLEAVGAVVDQRLSEIAELLDGRDRGPVAATAFDPGPVAELLARGPVGAARSPLGRAGPAARRALLRAIRPFSSYERQVDQQLLAALVQAGDAIATHAELLRALQERLERLETRLAETTFAQLSPLTPQEEATEEDR